MMTMMSDEEASILLKAPFEKSSNRRKPSTRDSIEKRRLKQDRENVSMLGVLESLEDGDDYVEETLATIEYSASAKEGTFLNDFIENTAPYMPQWQYSWRRMYRRLMSEKRQQRIKTYGPWVLVLTVYMVAKIAWSPSTAIPATDASIALNTFHEGISRQQTTTTTGGLQSGGIFQAPSTSLRKPKVDIFVSKEQTDDPMELPPSSFEARLENLKQVSEQGRAAPRQQQTAIERPPPPKQADQVEEQPNTPESAIAAPQPPPASEGDSDWQPRKPGENAVHPTNLVSAGQP